MSDVAGLAPAPVSDILAPMRGRGVTAVLGPTNTGKTHLAVERMLGHASGMIGLPLRLLAGVFRLVFSSSATVYGDPASVPLREDFPTSATNPYGWTKVMQEQVLRDVADSTDISMLIVTHEMQFARDVSHKVMMFDGGQVLEQGPPDEVLSNPTHERTKRFLTSIL